MKISLTSALMFIFVTFCVVFGVNYMNFNVQMDKVNNYHYATVNEIESSDFAPSVINERITNSEYTTTITEKSVKEDLRIYEVKTSAEIGIPILGYSITYTKVSTAR